MKVPTESPYLAYWQWIDSQETGCSYDYGKVFINNTVVNSYGLCKSSNTGGWVKHIVNLSSYAGQTVTLQIRATTDSTINSNLFVDDVVFQPSNTAAADFACGYLDRDTANRRRIERGLNISRHASRRSVLQDCNVAVSSRTPTYVISPR